MAYMICMVYGGNVKVRGSYGSNNSLKRRLVDETCKMKIFFHKQAVANRLCHQQLL